MLQRHTTLKPKELRRLAWADTGCFKVSTCTVPRITSFSRFVVELQNIKNRKMHKVALFSNPVTISPCQWTAHTKTASHSGPCTTCELRQKANPKMKHLIQMKVQEKYKEVYQWLKSEKPTLSDTACICLPCAKQI